jgi:broad specificity phosphatase PhoE
MRRILRWLTGALALLVFSGAHAQTVDVPALAGMMKQGGYVIVLRHGATNRDQADTDPLNFDNVAKQRLLSEQGKRVAAQVGEAFKAFGIPLGKVYTSQFNRAVETGRLIGGEVTPTADVTEGGLVVTPIENDRRAEALRKMAAAVPEAGEEYADRYPQAEHHGRVRQGLVRCQRGRGVDLQAGRRRKGGPRRTRPGD